MQGVSTSTAGFIGLAERGPAIGQPQLVTNFTDYKRMFGGYLSEAAYGSARFLPYAIEQFFANGGSRAYIMSVTDGLYRQLALEFAEEPEPAAPAGNEYRISLELILETLRKLEPSEGTERVRTERLLERMAGMYLPAVYQQYRDQVAAVPGYHQVPYRSPGGYPEWIRRP